MPESDGVFQGVIFNAYPDSIGKRLSDSIELLKKPQLKDAFSYFYVLPTFFHSDLDRGFSVIDYDIEEEMASPDDLADLESLGIGLKFDLVLNHLSVGSPQFHDMLEKGDESRFKDFFIDWNEFWAPDGPSEAELDKLFMRKPGLPILYVRFPDGSERPYWNTFYQEVNYPEITPEDLAGVDHPQPWQCAAMVDMVNTAIREKTPLSEVDFGEFEELREKVLNVVEAKRSYLGQMDLNARSEKVWEFYGETLKKLAGYGARLIRLDAFAYLHKERGERNFFNKPGTWDYLARLKAMADDCGLKLLPEIHAAYGEGLHEEVAGQGFLIYDFFFPGLVIDALDRGVSGPLRHWIADIQEKNIKTVNMLGCHDGIPVLDLRGDGTAEGGLLSEDEIEAVMNRIVERGGRVKNLFGPDGKKIAYYQVNATFYSALGEDDRKLLIARAIQMFMPGLPQVWYLDLFAGKNDYAAADRGGTGGHKEINRTTLDLDDIEADLERPVVRDQLKLMLLRNTFPAFAGRLVVEPSEAHHLTMIWINGPAYARLDADLKTHGFVVTYDAGDGREKTIDRR